MMCVCVCACVCGRLRATRRLRANSAAVARACCQSEPRPLRAGRMPDSRLLQASKQPPRVSWLLLIGCAFSLSLSLSFSLSVRSCACCCELSTIVYQLMTSFNQLTQRYTHTRLRRYGGWQVVQSLKDERFSMPASHLASTQHNHITVGTLIHFMDLRRCCTARM